MRDKEMYSIYKYSFREFMGKVDVEKNLSILRRVISVEDTRTLDVLCPGNSDLLLQYSRLETGELLSATERITIDSEDHYNEVMRMARELKVEGFLINVQISECTHYIDVCVVDEEMYNTAVKRYNK